jgi:hypothetical protein
LGNPWHISFFIMLDRAVIHNARLWSL